MTDFENKKVLNLTSLDNDSINKLFTSEYMAIRIKNFFTPEVSRTLAEKYCKHPDFGKYANAKLIGRVGQAYFEGLEGEANKELYRDKSRDWLASLRSACAPYIQPMDRLRLELDEAWINGARLANIQNRNTKAFAGLVRVFEEGSGTEIHQDKASWDAMEIDGFETEITMQLAANVYLELPSQGGSVDLWDLSLKKHEYEEKRNNGSYGVNPKELGLGNPEAHFSPQIGDLWIWRADKLHRVNDAGKGRRVTQSCFIGYRGTNRELIIWS
tara:strand:- start:885 stop:1697 length:813 start_codon:yes stop_codon:yes gene_type:complete